MTCTVTEMELSAYSKVGACSPEYPVTAFTSPKMLILFLLKSTRPMSHPLWAMELPRQVADAKGGLCVQITPGSRMCIISESIKAGNGFKSC